MNHFNKGINLWGKSISSPISYEDAWAMQALEFKIKHASEFPSFLWMVMIERFSVNKLHTTIFPIAWGVDSCESHCCLKMLFRRNIMLTNPITPTPPQLSNIFWTTLQWDTIYHRFITIDSIEVRFPISSMNSIICRSTDYGKVCSFLRVRK